MEKEQVWLPLQTVYNKELTVAAYLKEQGIEHYIPMTYELRDTGREGECSHVLVPAIHNLIFIHCPYDANWCRQFASEAPLPVYFLKKERNGNDYCTVSERDMQNFMHATSPTSRHAVHRFRKASRQAQRPRPGSTPRSALRCDRQVPPLRRPPLHRHRNTPKHRPAQSELHLVRNHRRVNSEKQYKITNRQA